MNNLRFAPIVRVSTEKQEKKGESLNTQTSQIKQYVSILNGTIPDSCWQYSGQEHATPNQERTKLEKLLNDSSKGLFDAVIVCDASRWSRDNYKSKEGLSILRQNNIRFFVGTTEYDLHNPTQDFILGMFGEINQFFAKEQAKKSIENRIARTKSGVPALGRMPWGRTYDKKTGEWILDLEKKKLIEQAAQRYINGESMANIAKSIGLEHVQLHKILSKRAGTDWGCHFYNSKTKEDEIVVMKIPPLLDEDTIKQIHERIEINKTYIRGNIKHHYLLTSMVFCKHCGYTMMAWTSRSNKQYFRHPRHHECTYPNKMIPAEELANTVLIHLVKTFGDPEKIQKSIERATPDLTKVNELTKEKKTIEVELKKLSNKKEKIIDAIANGIITNEESQKRMERFREDEKILNERYIHINSELSLKLDAKQIKNVSLWAGKVIKDATKNNPELIFKRSYEWKRNLVLKAFAGKSSNGEPFGVYIDYIDDKFTIEIKGSFFNTMETLPMPDESIENLFNVESNEEVARIRNEISNMHGECDAYLKYHIICSI